MKTITASAVALAVLMPACAKPDPEFTNVRYIDARSAATATATGSSFHYTESELQDRATEMAMQTCPPEIVEMMDLLDGDEAGAGASRLLESLFGSRAVSVTATVECPV